MSEKKDSEAVPASARLFLLSKLVALFLLLFEFLLLSLRLLLGLLVRLAIFLGNFAIHNGVPVTVLGHEGAVFAINSLKLLGIGHIGVDFARIHSRSSGCGCGCGSGTISGCGTVSGCISVLLL